MSDHETKQITVNRDHLKLHIPWVLMFRLSVMVGVIFVGWAMTTGVERVMDAAQPRIEQSVQASLPSVIPNVIKGLEPQIQSQLERQGRELQDRIFRELVRKDIHDLELNQLRHAIAIETTDRKDADNQFNALLKEVVREQSQISRMLDSIAAKVGATTQTNQSK